MTTIADVRRFPLTLGLLGLLVVLAAGCGSGGGAKNAAVVGGEPIPVSRLDVLMNAAQIAYSKNGQAFPNQGTSAYRELRERALAYLVVETELEQRAARQLGVRVSDAQVAAAVETIKKRDFGGSDTKLADSIAAQGMTRAEFDEEQRLSLTRDAVTKKIAAGATVTQKDVEAYYNSHRSEFRKPAQREVRAIRVERVELANRLYAQLKKGAAWEPLVQKYTLDEPTKATGGKFTVVEKVGSSIVDKTAFSLRTGQIAEPFPTIHGWHILQALEPVTPAEQLPLSRVTTAIRRALGQRDQDTRVSKWVSETKREYCRDKKVTYEKGFAPTDDPCSTVN
jgi:parvulin-like peptidyl-prolyl isomerase